ncbi:hypothetical protein CONPUDRAFT_144687 [Coniophora puteana RWD-64-598 SS2]|uniref:Uncharacterized protein n=1 Tax=Coniophora puteana (strain RWD-64-598) TaxID=741705 RepID=A0A5M3MPX6_CONPW|nr:uncharacterized protein CONPUDRAFT_144687 [Coniophora puteana RWD-64-598 SS2]EIW80735.1 hypothetical protein CONPUDRAFT_144687 [Coniophora puteana RWD-64-598 SS2]
MASIPRSLKVPHAILSSLLKVFHRGPSTRLGQKTTTGSVPVKAPKFSPFWKKRGRRSNKSKKGKGKGKKTNKKAGSGLGLFVQCVHKSFGVPIHEDGTTGGPADASGKQGTRGEGGPAIYVEGPSLTGSEQGEFEMRPEDMSRACEIQTADDTVGSSSTSEERFFDVALSRFSFGTGAAHGAASGPSSGFGGMTPSPSIMSGLSGLANANTYTDAARCTYSTLSRDPDRLRPSTLCRGGWYPNQRPREQMPIVLESDSEEDYGQVIPDKPRQLHVVNCTPVGASPPSPPSPTAHCGVPLTDAPLESREPLARPDRGTTVGVGLGVGDVLSRSAAIVDAASSESRETMSTVPSGWSALPSLSSSEAMCGGLSESATTIYSTSAKGSTSACALPSSSTYDCAFPSSVPSSGSMPCAPPLIGAGAHPEHAHVAAANADNEAETNDFDNEGPEMDTTDQQLEHNSSYEDYEGHVKEEDIEDLDPDASILGMYTRSHPVSTPGSWLWENDDESYDEYGYSFNHDRTYRSLAPSPSPRRVYGDGNEHSIIESSVADFMSHSVLYATPVRRGADGDNVSASGRRRLGSASAVRSARKLLGRSPFWFLTTPLRSVCKPVRPPRENSGDDAADQSVDTDDLWAQMRDAIDLARDGAYVDPAKLLASRAIAPRTPQRTPLRMQRLIGPAAPGSRSVKASKLSSVTNANSPRSAEKYATPDKVWWAASGADLNMCM